MKKSLVYYLSQIKTIYPEVEDITRAEFDQISAEINAQLAAGEEVTAHQKLYSKTYRFLKWFVNYYTENGFKAKFFVDNLSSFQLKILEIINNKVASGKWFESFNKYEIRIHASLDRCIENISKRIDREKAYSEINTKQSISMQDLLNDIVINETYENLLDEISLRELKNLINGAIATLTLREQKVVKSYYGLEGQPRTLQSIGDEFNLTKETIRVILEKAIKRLRGNPAIYIKLREYVK